MAATDIRDLNSLREWLSSFTDTQRWHIAMAMCCRCALRLFPLINQKGTLAGSEYEQLLLTTIWRLSLTRSARSASDGQMVSLSVGSSPSIEMQEYAYLVHAGDFRFAAFHAAISAVRAFATAHDDYLYDAGGAAGQVVGALVLIAKFDEFAAADMWESIREDAVAIAAGKNVLELYNMPIWRKVPQWWRKEWHACQHLFSTAEMAAGGWGIWVEWYDSVAQGQPAFGLKNRATAEALERAIAWGGRDGEARVNFSIRELSPFNDKVAAWVAEARAAEAAGFVEAIPPELDFPAQSLDATMFGLNAQGQIDRVAIPPEQQLLITPMQLRQYETLRSDAERLCARGQILGKLSTEIADLISALPRDMTHAGVFDVWRAINRLRRTMNAHRRVVDSDEPHEAKLELSIAEELAFLLDTANNFAFDDPSLRRRDEQSIPPQDKKSIADEKALGDDLVEFAIAIPGMFTVKAMKSVEAEELNAKSAGEDAHGQQAIDQTNKTRRNLIAALLSYLKDEPPFAWREFRKGVYTSAGATSVLAGTVFATSKFPAASKFFQTQAINLLNYVKAVYNNPTLTSFIEYISKSIGY